MEQLALFNLCFKGEAKPATQELAVDEQPVYELEDEETRLIDALLNSEIS